MTTNPSIQSQPDALQEFLTTCQRRVDSLLAEILSIASADPKLSEAMSYAVLGGGKRVRPVLVYGSNLAAGGNLEEADQAACAVELIHAYSLVHDDLPAMDDDDLRRGKPTVHKAFDDGTAVLVGDGLQSLAFRTLSEEQFSYSANTQLRMLRVLSEAVGAMGMVGGQALDFSATGGQLTLAELETMHRLKTGALIQASVELGGLCAEGVSDGQLEALRNYAGNIGLAFQIQDDILDETSETDVLGKPRGSDSALEKPTYVSVLGLDRARDRAQELANNAIAALENFPVSADPLRNLAAYIVHRVS